MSLALVLLGAPACNKSYKSCTAVEVEARDGAEAAATVKVDGSPRAGVAVDFYVGDDANPKAVSTTDAAGVATAALPAGTTEYTAKVDPFSQPGGELRKLCPEEDSARISR